mgnify:CR=1 FL=1|jgi:hypothetical protein
MRKSRKQVNRENRVRLAKHDRRLRAIAKKKLEKSEELAKVIPSTVDNSI